MWSLLLAGHNMPSWGIVTTYDFWMVMNWVSGVAVIYELRRYHDIWSRSEMRMVNVLLCTAFHGK